jgi:hemolysin activation/secretion protein
MIGPLPLFKRGLYGCLAANNQPYFADLMWMTRSGAQWRLMLMKPLFALMLVAFPTLAAAQPVVPSAGMILQQIQPVTPPAASNRSGLKIEQRDASNLPTSAPFLAQTIDITGNTLFATATLHALVADAEGKFLTLAQLGELAARITVYYQSRGYPLARAIIPAQTIMTGIVRIEVHEATYGEISLDNSSRVKDALLHDALASLQRGKIIGQTGLDRALLQIADIPGVVVSATLKPGDVVGTSDLLVRTTPSPMVQGNVILNNYGDNYTGRSPIRATVSLINPLQHGDVRGGLKNLDRVLSGVSA